MCCKISRRLNNPELTNEAALKKCIGINKTGVLTLTKKDALRITLQKPQTFKKK
jgi:hypothetical protein